jgi:hypothetical protein
MPVVLTGVSSSGSVLIHRRGRCRSVIVVIHRPRTPACSLWQACVVLGAVNVRTYGCYQRIWQWIKEPESTLNPPSHAVTNVSCTRQHQSFATLVLAFCGPLLTVDQELILRLDTGDVLRRDASVMPAWSYRDESHTRSRRTANSVISPLACYAQPVATRRDGSMGMR